MDCSLFQNAQQIIQGSLRAVLPDEAVRRALGDFRPRGGKTLLVAAGKAAWQMAKAATDALGRVDGGVVATKYGHVLGDIPGVECMEGGLPVPDVFCFSFTSWALDMSEVISE